MAMLARKLAASCLVLGVGRWSVDACTNLIVTRGASADGSSLFSYTADSGTLYGTLGHYPRGQHPPGAKRDIYNWDSGEYLGQIDEVAETFNVIGNLNEHGLAIGETTFGGNQSLAGGEGTLDYGSLIWVTLQRAKTAREAIAMFDALIVQYGYVSEGESFTIADMTETWVMELIGKGKYQKGAVWVAVRIPDGHVSAHANQARIQQFPWNDPENCKYSKDVMSFAVKVGLWDASRPPSEFSFSDTYDPLTFSGARQADARAWSFLSAVAEDPEFGRRYEDYVLGRNLTAAARMPLSVKPRQPISALELMAHMRNHYEGTALDATRDVGAGSSGTPFRSRPIVWGSGGSRYVHERHVGTPQAGWNFVAQLRPHLPAPIGGLLWFAVDDATFSVHVPFYGGTLRVPPAYADGNGDALTYSSTSAFWAFNTVANFVYPRYHIAPEVIEKAHAEEAKLVDRIQDLDHVASTLYDSDPERAMELLTGFSEAQAARTVSAQFALFQQLMVKYRDGFRISSLGSGAPDHGGQQGGVVPKVEEIGYAQKWYDRIVADTGDHYMVLTGNGEAAKSLEANKLRVISKGVTSKLVDGGEAAKSQEVSNLPVSSTGLTAIHASEGLDLIV